MNNPKQSNISGLCRLKAGAKHSRYQLLVQRSGLHLYLPTIGIAAYWLAVLLIWHFRFLPLTWYQKRILPLHLPHTVTNRQETGVCSTFCTGAYSYKIVHSSCRATKAWDWSVLLLLQGCYVNIDEFKSRVEVMSRRVGSQHITKRVLNNCWSWKHKCALSLHLLWHRETNRDIFRKCTSMNDQMVSCQLHMKLLLCLTKVIQFNWSNYGPHMLAAWNVSDIEWIQI